MPLRKFFVISSAAILFALTASAQAQMAPMPWVDGIQITNSQKRVRFAPFPAAQEYRMLQSDRIGGAFSVDSSGSFSAYEWTAPFNATDPIRFYAMQPVVMDTNALLTATVLNRLAYGPTPDELERVRAMGPDAYIQEQLAPENIQEQLAIDAPPITSNGWRYCTATGRGSASVLYLYLNGEGEGYIDDIKLVRGAVPEVGQNLVRNGDFESGAISPWETNGSHGASVIVTNVARSGAASLKLVAEERGASRDDSVAQEGLGLSGSQTYTLSYWFLPSGTNPPSHTVRLSGEGIVSPAGYPLLLERAASIEDLQQWHIHRAVESKRQLLETLLQFWENHFVTQYEKSADWLDRIYENEDPRRRNYAVDFEYRELQRWRQALLNPQCTFHDLLKISAESPAMILYLDTIDSRGNDQNVPNENFARELLELFTFGVDNGYDQADIVEMAKVWTGWSVDKKPELQILDPLTESPRDIDRDIDRVALPGVWTFHYKGRNHYPGAKIIFPGKTVPVRFGPPHAGHNYELRLPAGRSGTNGIKDGYEVMAHLANQPFTQEYISVKLCRLFVHDDFVHGVYDYTAPNLSPEAALVKRCMEAWESGSPKGQIRQVLSAIFSSELFRSHGGSLQKIKTPLEFAVSAVRALRSDNEDGTFTAQTDARWEDVLDNFGGMSLFNRAEPDGYPEYGPAWISAGTLSERLRFIQSYLTHPNATPRRPDEAGGTLGDPVQLLRKKLPQASWTSAEAVADYFLGILYPAEGRANLELYRRAAINFLNTNDSGAASQLSALSTTGNPSAYDTRVRGMVAMLMTFPRFQEQ